MIASDDAAADAAAAAAFSERLPRGLVLSSKHWFGFSSGGVVALGTEGSGHGTSPPEACSEDTDYRSTSRERFEQRLAALIRV